MVQTREIKTIGNPLSWAARRLFGAAGHVAHSVESIGGEEMAGLRARSRSLPQVQPLTWADLRAALRLGYADFAALRGDVMVMCLIYPAIGALLIGAAFNMNLLPILFPLGAGFALIGPLAAVGLYELSRRRERGERVQWSAAFAVLRSGNFGAIMVLGLYLGALYALWIVLAHGIWLLTLGPVPPGQPWRVSGGGVHHVGGLGDVWDRHGCGSGVCAPGVGHQRCQLPAAG